MPLRDGKPTRHELRVAELCQRSPDYEAAYTYYMASDPWPEDWVIVLDCTDEEVDEMGDPIDEDEQDDD